MTVSVVVPSAREHVLTVESIPDREDVEVQIRRDDGLNHARNEGVRAATHDAIVILDDDLVFDPEWFDELCRKVHDRPDTLWTALGTGILPTVSWPEGFTPGMGRVMGFRRQLWDDAGGFPVPCSHGGDTDFMLSAFEAGYDVRPLAHEWEHRDDEIDTYDLLDNVRWLWFLLKRHPKLVGPRLPSLLLKKLHS